MNGAQTADGGRNEGSAIRGAIQARITDGRIRPGERIVEQRLAEDLGTSRTPVREALTAMMALGQVTRTRSGWETVDHTPEELRDAFRLRASLESFAAFNAALEATEEQQQAVREAYDRMHVASGRSYSDALERAQVMASLNRRFHQQVAIASNNTRLPGVMDAVVVAPLVFSAFSWYTEAQLERSDYLHGAICDAICNRDPHRAEWLMAEHILEGWEVVERNVEPAADGQRSADLWHRLQPTAASDGANNNSK
ncbi:MAG: GntR family transcriptional regulator [Actinobacteria bacterium]|nr:GntR family transcriptional regulator [Actinomycetota bacterium]